ncbi:MAG TPA: hypothetical protein VH740_09175 [Vicinamibacterales bacterium]
MRRTFSLAIVAALMPFGAVASADSTVARTAVVASAEIRTRTSIVASTELLRFHVTDARQPIEAVVTFSAGARAAASSDVLLIVTTEKAMESAADSPGEMALTVSSGSETRPVAAGDRVVAAQWIGGGVRSGQLHFQFRAAPGTYSVPVKLQLIVP